MPLIDHSLHSRSRTVLRIAAGILGFCVLVPCGGMVLAATGQPDRTGSVFALAVFLGAFALLHWGITASRTGRDAAWLRRHLRACRVTLGLAALVELVLFSGLPIPTSLSALGPHLPILAMLAATLTAAVLLRRAPRAAFALLLVMALWCAFVVVRLLWRIEDWRMPGAGAAYAIAFALNFWTAAAVWQATWAFRRVRPLLDPAR